MKTIIFLLLIFEAIICQSFIFDRTITTGDNVYNVRYSPDGKFLASSLRKFGIVIYNATDYTKMK